MEIDGLLPEDTKVRSSKHLNNLIEQDHRHIKSRTNVMLGFKRFRSARDLSRTGAYRRALQNQRDGLLAFAGLLDTKLDAIARTHNVARHLVREVCMLHRKSETSSAFWQGWNRLLARIGRPFHGVYAAVSGALHSTPRSSSLVENLNSRLRVYLTNRRHLKGGRAWLDYQIAYDRGGRGHNG
ncbi:hypothetical protein QFZ94_000002 [Paraburkholderia sp. JPY465]